MDTIYVERNPAYPQQVWLVRSTGARAMILLGTGSPSDADEEPEWPEVLAQAGAALGLHTGDRMAIRIAEPSLQAYPWELLRGPACELSLVRASPTTDLPRSAQVPRPLRVLLALADPASALLRVAIDHLQQQEFISLDVIEPAQFTAYAGQSSYYHAAHVSATAPCLTSAQALRRQCGAHREGGLSLLIVHAHGGPLPLPVLAESELPAILALGSQMDETEASHFLADVYAGLIAGMPIDGAVLAARARQDLALPAEPILFTGRLSGEIWPVPSPPLATRPRTPSEPAVPERLPMGTPTAGLFVAGNMNVAGDIVMGPKTQTVQQAGGDMVTINRQSGQPALQETAPTVCPACGAQVQRTHLFCQQCGQPLPTTLPGRGHGD